MSGYKKEAINFLLYSYFGITLDTDWIECVKCAIMKAYNDATIQGAFNAQISADDNVLKEKANNAKKVAADSILAHINDLLVENPSQSFDDWHGTTCESLKNAYSEIQMFTYGNAQKWVNMTIKYICIIDALIPTNKYHCEIEKRLTDFHVPIDSYIIDSLWSENDYSLDLPLKTPFTGKRDRAYSKPSEYVCPWSGWDKTMYDNLHKKISESKLDLLWENATWIKQAEKRKKQDKENRFNSFFKEEQNK